MTEREGKKAVYPWRMIRAEDETRGMLLKTTWPSFAKEWREG